MVQRLQRRSRKYSMKVKRLWRSDVRKAEQQNENASEENERMHHVARAQVETLCCVRVLDARLHKVGRR